MTNRQRFFMNGILLTGVGLAVRSVSLVFNSFITKRIGAEGIGLFTLIGTVYSFAVTFATSGISLTVTRLVSSVIGEGKEKEVRGVLASSVIYSLIFSIFASCVLFFGAEYFGARVLADNRCIVPLRILSLSLVPLSLSSVFTGYFVGVKRVSKNAVIQVLAQAFKIITTVILVLKLPASDVEKSITMLTVSITLTEILVFAVALIQYLFDKRRYKKDGNGGHFQGVLSMALPLAVSAYIRSALLTLEHVLIPRRLRERGDSKSDALSSYGILHGMALPTLLYPMATLSSFASLLVPEFSASMVRGERERMKRIASEAINTTLVYSVAAMTFIILFSEEIGYVVYNSYGAGHYIALIAPVIPIMYLDHVTDSMLKGIGEHVYSMWVNISDSFLSVILVWILIPRLGIGGYAVVIVCMEGYNFLLSAVRLYSKMRFKINLVSSLLIPLFSAGVSAAFSRRIFAKDGIMSAPVWLFLEILFAICIFIAIYMSTKVVINRYKKQGAVAFRDNRIKNRWRHQ